MRNRLICFGLTCALLACAMPALGAAGVGDTPGHAPSEAVRLPDGEPAAETLAAPEYAINLGAEALPVMVYGRATLGEGRVTLKNDNPTASFQEIVLNVTEETHILDAVTGESRTFRDLKDNETLYAYAGPMIAASAPPMSHAVLILCNFPADFGAPVLARAEQVSRNEAGGLSVLVSGDIVLRLEEETGLLPGPGWADGAASLSDIQPGTWLLSWYSMVLESYPGQAYPSKVMVFPYTYTGWTAMAPGALSVNGAAVALAPGEAPFVQDGRLMVPVRKFAEALGCGVVWDGSEPDRVTVEQDGAVRYTFTLSGGTATVEGDMVMEMTTAPVVRGGVTFLAAEDLIAWHGVKLEGAWPV